VEWGVSFHDQMALKRCVGRPSKFYVAYSERPLNPAHKTFFVIFLTPSRQYLKLGHGHFLPNLFQFSIHSNHSVTY
jgi:hypothetical protein